MGLIKFILVGLLLLTSAGCSQTSRTFVKRYQSNLYSQGYRTGVKENIRKFAKKFDAGDFPYFNWKKPARQKVKIPAHISNGLFVPEHVEEVIISPGEWKSGPAYPISSGQRRNNYDTEVVYNSVNAADITTLPQQYGEADSGNNFAGKSADNKRRMD